MLLSASGIILKNKRILLLQRSNYSERYPGYWGCPGGRAEIGETAEENVIREVKEECNLNFQPTQILKKGDWDGKFYYRFLGDWNGEIKIQETEVISYNWFTYQEAIELNLAFDYKEIIETLRLNKLL